jgi:predicted nucleic acid-binding protein
VPQRKRAERRATPIHLIDTNVLLRFLIGDDPPKAARAKALMQRVERGEETIELVDEVVTETAWTLERFYKVPRAEIARNLAAVLSFSGMRASSRSVVLLALQVYATSTADFVDCVLAARARHKNVGVYTFDETDFKKLGVAWETP